MNKIIVNSDGNWIDTEKCQVFESRTENGKLRNEKLFLTPNKNFVSLRRESKDAPAKYSVLTHAQARSWFRTNKYNQEEIPEFLRDYSPELELK